MKNRNSKKGFTLVEIMIVVVIIGLLAAMAIPAFQKVRENSRRSAIENNVRMIASAADQYFMETGLTTVALSALVGPNNYIKKPIKVVAGETYDTDIAQGATYTYTTTDGRVTVTGTW